MLRNVQWTLPESSFWHLPIPIPSSPNGLQANPSQHGFPCFHGKSHDPPHFKHFSSPRFHKMELLLVSTIIVQRLITFGIDKVVFIFYRYIPSLYLFSPKPNPIPHFFFDLVYKFRIYQESRDWSYWNNRDLWHNLHNVLL